MRITHISAKLAATTSHPGIFVQTLHKVTDDKCAITGITDSTKTTYRIRQQQVMKYLLTTGMIGSGPEDWDESRIYDFKITMLSPGMFSSDVARRAQDLVFETLEQCRRDGHQFYMPKKLKYDRADKPPTFCTPEEIEKLRNYKFQSEKLARVRDLFLIQCFTGLSYCDLKRINRKILRHIDGIPVLQDLRQKMENRSQKPFTIPVIPQLKTLLDKYDWEPPIIANSNYNLYLKEMAGVVGIDKALKTHDARRTCAMYYLSLTGDYHISAAVLGNSPEMVRKRYAPYLPMHLINALKKANLFGKTG